MNDLILLGIFDFFSDMSFVLKVFVFIAIVGFLNQHMQNKILKVIIFMFMGYFVLIANWATFGTIWVIYTVLGLGVSGVLVDFFFVSMQGDPEKHQQQMASMGGDNPFQPTGYVPPEEQMPFRPSTTRQAPKTFRPGS
jgi:hypothetical protein